MPARRSSPTPPVRGAGILLTVVFLCGCAPLQHRSIDAAALDLPATVELTGTPFYPQRIHHCGPAALATVLNDSGIPVSPDALAPMIYTPGREGSFAAEMAAAARRHKRLAYRLDPDFADLLGELAGGHPVVVMQNLGLSWYPRWHYAVAVGYDLQNREIILRSGERRRYVVGFSTFEHTWRRGGYWALRVIEPGALPANADPVRYLDATGELERLGFYEAANTAYRAAIKRWPDNPTAWMGKGNTDYRLGDPDVAENAYRRVLKLDADHGAAHNNLAQVEHDRGNLEQAEKAARTAVSLGGPLESTYRQTLYEILESKAAKGAVTP